MSAQSVQSWIEDAPMDETQDVWAARIAAIPAPVGFHETLGPDHSALFVNRGKTLIVSFDMLPDVYRTGENRLPWGLGESLPADWSVLGVMAHQATWYRDDAVFDFFDRLQADGFFDQFDQVVFYGVSMGAYGAVVFSSAAPGSTVIAISPQATLEREFTAWDNRFRQARRRNFTSRYGYGPEMVATADQVYVFYDPLNAPDAMHAVLFQGDNLTRLRCRHMGHQIAAYLSSLQLLNPILENCVDQNLDPVSFYRMMRKRHESGRYQKEILARLRTQEKHELLVRYCTAILARRRAPAFRAERKKSLKILGRTE